jgi:hypothetical protein
MVGAQAGMMGGGSVSWSVWPEGVRLQPCEEIPHQRPALFAVDVRLCGGKRKGQRWNKRRTMTRFCACGSKVVGNHHHRGAKFELNNKGGCILST